MEKFSLKVTNAPSVRFTGEMLASKQSYDDEGAGGAYSGMKGRWTELELYKTRRGKFICHQIDRTSWLGEHDGFSTEVCETLAEVKEFFGHGWLAKELYNEAKIDDSVTVE